MHDLLVMHVFESLQNLPHVVSHFLLTHKHVVLHDFIEQFSAGYTEFFKLCP